MLMNEHLQALVRDWRAKRDHSTRWPEMYHDMVRAELYDSLARQLEEMLAMSGTAVDRPSSGELDSLQIALHEALHKRDPNDHEEAALIARTVFENFLKARTRD